jgi:hypothetical protein
MPLTLQNPTGRTGTPFSRNRNAPHEPAPVSTGERMAVRLSSPLPRCTFTPAMRFRTSELWVAPTSSMSAAPMRSRLSGVASVGTAWRCAVTTTSSSCTLAGAAQTTAGSSASISAGIEQRERWGRGPGGMRIGS